MKYLGQISDPKDLVRKEYVDDADTALSTRINTNEDNIAMAESDIESLQGDVSTLKTDNTATKAAVKTLQDTYVPNTRKVNGLALDADIEIPNTLTVNLTQSGSTYTADKTFDEINEAYKAGKSIQCKNSNIVTDLYTLIEEQKYILFSSTNGYTTESRVVYNNGSWDVGLEYLVPASRTINGKSLATNVTLSASDVGAPEQVIDSSGNIIIKTSQNDVIWNYNVEDDLYILGQEQTKASGNAGLRQLIYGKYGSCLKLDDNLYYKNAKGNASFSATSSTTNGTTNGKVVLSSDEIYITKSDEKSLGKLTNLADPVDETDAVNFRILNSAYQKIVDNMPSKTSQLTNDSNFVSATDLVSTETTSAINANTLENHASSYFATASSVSDLTTLVNTINTFINTLATVATTGSYNDLKNQPTIPTIYSGTTDPSASLGKNGDIYIKYSS